MLSFTSGLNVKVRLLCFDSAEGTHHRLLLMLLLLLLCQRRPRHRAAAVVRHRRHRRRLRYCDVTVADRLRQSRDGRAGGHQRAIEARQVEGPAAGAQVAQRLGAVAHRLPPAARLRPHRGEYA